MTGCLCCLCFKKGDVYVVDVLNKKIHPIKTSIKIEKPLLRNTIFEEMLNKNNYYLDKPSLQFTSLTADVRWNWVRHTYFEARWNCIVASWNWSEQCFHTLNWLYSQIQAYIYILSSPIKTIFTAEAFSFKAYFILKATYRYVYI